MGVTALLKANCQFVQRCAQLRHFLAGDGDQVANIFRERIVARGLDLALGDGAPPIPSRASQKNTNCEPLIFEGFTIYLFLVSAVAFFS